VLLYGEFARSDLHSVISNSDTFVTDCMRSPYFTMEGEGKMYLDHANAVG